MMKKIFFIFISLMSIILIYEVSFLNNPKIDFEIKKEADFSEHRTNKYKINHQDNSIQNNYKDYLLSSTNDDINIIAVMFLLICSLIVMVILEIYRRKE